MSLTPLDEATFKLAADTLNRGRLHGVSPITALHSAGLLLGPDLANRLREEVLAVAADNIRRSRLRDLLDDGYLRNGATPAQVRAAIADRLDELALLARKGEFR